MKRRTLALVLTLSLLLGMTAVLPAVADEVASEPIIKNGGFEEVAEDGLSPIGWFGGGMVTPSNTDTGNLSHSGKGFLYIEAGKSVYSSNFELEPETDYILTLYSRSSIENSGQIDIRFRANGNTFDKSIPGQYAPGEHRVIENFGSANSEPAEGETDERFQWEKQQFSFTTPALTEGAMFYINEKKSDAYFCIDDISIAPSGKEPNLLRNGYFTTFVNDGARPSGFASSSNFVTAPTYSVDENGDVVATIASRNANNEEAYFGIHALGLLAGRYKLSFDYKNDGSASYKPSFYMKATTDYPSWTAGWRSISQNAYDKGKWQTFELYFTVPEGGVRLSDFRVKSGYITTDKPAYFKNIRLWWDEATVEYGSHFVETRSPLVTDATLGHSTEWYRPIDAISDVKATDGVHTIQTKAHYIPTGTSDESFMLLDSVFKVYDDGREVLTDIAFKNGSTTGGIVGGANSRIMVPELTGEEDYTYEIRSFIWSGTGTMQPKAAVSTISY